MWKKSLFSAVVLTIILFQPLQAALKPLSTEALQPLASLNTGGATVEWQPRVEDYDRLILTVVGPNDLVIRREFEQGKSPTLDLTDERGQSWPDGDYTYELRVVPRVNEHLRQEIRRAREAGNETLVDKLLDSGDLRRASRVQSGSLTIRHGLVVMPGASGESTTLESKPAPEPVGAAEKTVVTPPLIVPGGACIGDDCTTSDTPSTLVLKEDSPRIVFEDTFGFVGSDRDWSLGANMPFGGGDSFFLQDVDAGTKPSSLKGMLKRPLYS